MPNGTASLPRRVAVSALNASRSGKLRGAPGGPDLASSQTFASPSGGDRPPRVDRAALMLPFPPVDRNEYALAPARWWTPLRSARPHEHPSPGETLHGLRAPTRPPGLALDGPDPVDDRLHLDVQRLADAGSARPQDQGDDGPEPHPGR